MKGQIIELSGCQAANLKRKIDNQTLWEQADFFRTEYETRDGGNFCLLRTERPLRTAGY